MGDFSLTPESTKRFWDKVAVSGDEDCWEWTASRNPDGYGHFHVVTDKKRNLGAHCVSFGLANGYIPPAGSVVRHTCDNPPCCNPAHLIAGTRSDNAQDAKERGLLWHPGLKGETNPRAKLTTDSVISIRDRLRRGAHPKAIAGEYGMSAEMIRRIRDRKSWAHV